MRCFECDGNMDCAIGQEKIICPHCDELLYNNLNLCDKCGLIWKSVNDKVLDSTIFRFPPGVPLSRKEWIDTIFDNSIQPSSSSSVGAKSMLDFIHKCTKCGDICYYNGEDVYKCISCGFELEVVNG